MQRIYTVRRQWDGRAERTLAAVLFLIGVVIAAGEVGAQQGQATLVEPLQMDPSGAFLSSVPGDRAPAHHPTRILVRFTGGASKTFLPGSGPTRVFPGHPDLFLVETPRGLSVREAVARYRANRNVLYAEPDYYVRALDTTPSDPLWSSQWDMVKIAAPAAWDVQKDSSDVVVAVLDTGIDFSHPDLQANLWVNPADGSHGFSCLNGTVLPGGADDYGHGTHVAGTIGAATGNGIGMAGINWNVRLLSLKFLNSSGSGAVSDAILCFDKATALKQSGVNIRVTSNSWGGGGYSQSLKDAMARAEAAGILHVCAAGNSGQNADFSPMYPAAYDNRGIISVLATDQNDAGASFSNYGLASVDIAAPGLSTLSTVPTGACSLCDPTGYRSLSGTSMATPHVAGVAAALVHRNPALTPIEARDVVLDPGSYDAMADARAKSSTTGGRLNFFKSVGNPLLSSPHLNAFPSLAEVPSVAAASGGPVSLSASASDPDGDPLRIAWTKAGYQNSAWLMGMMLDTVFQNSGGNPFSFTAPAVARATTVSYAAATSDGRGGSALAQTFLTVLPGAAPGQPPTGNLSVSPSAGPAGTTFAVNYPAADPEGGTVLWDMRVATTGAAFAFCCYSGSYTTLTLNGEGVYRLRVEAVDRELNVSPGQTAVLRVGSAVGEPPIAAASFDTAGGPAPLTVHYDASDSYDPDGTIQAFYVDCSGNGPLTSSSATGSCVYPTAGPHLIRLFVADNSGLMDGVYRYVMATDGSPSGPPPDTTPPAVGITSPAVGATLTGSVQVTALATDNVGVARVDFYRDGGVLLGSSASAPYAITWNTAGVPSGAHGLYARAVDAAGNTGTSATATVTVAPADTTPPTASLTSPANGATVSRKSTVSLAATASDNVGVVRVEFLVNGSLQCTDTSSPYSCSWKVPAAKTGVYSLQAKAYDAAGNAGVSAVIAVNAK